MRNRKHDIERYLRGELSPSEMHALEKEALSDPFLAEALEGVEQAGADNFLYDLHKLNHSMRKRVRSKAWSQNKVVRLWTWGPAVAAALFLIGISGFIVVHLLREQRAAELSMANKVTAPEDTAVAEMDDSLTVASGGPSPLAMAEEKKAEEKPKQPPVRAKESGPTATVPPGAVHTDETATAQDQLLAENNDIKDIDKNAAGAERESAIPAREIPREPALKNEQAPSSEPEKADASELADKEAESVLKGKVAGVQSDASSAKKRSAASPGGVVTGTVTDETGERLAGVNVVVKGTDSGTVTDAEGNYSLQVPRDAVLVFGFIGYENTSVAVGDKSAVNVTLEQNIAALSEVVVTGYGTSRPAPASFKAAEPDGGKPDFKTYLVKAIIYPAQAVKNKTEGKVTIRFTVEPTGQLTGFEVVKGIGDGCEDELIRAIQQGPAWKPARQGDRPVSDKVRVRYKFELPK